MYRAPCGAVAVCALIPRKRALPAQTQILCSAAAAPHPFAQQHLKLFRPSKFGSERSGVGPEFEKGDGRLRPSLQQRLPGAEGPPEGCTTAPRHAACGGPLPSSAEGPCVIYCPNRSSEPSYYQVATLVPHCAVNRAATNSSQDPPVLGCCQQPTNSPASGASRRAGAKLAL